MCAGWTLLVLVLTNQSWLSRWESRLWLSCVVDDGPCAVVLRAGDALARETSLLVPNWGVALGILTIVLVAANYVLFDRLEII